MALSPQYSWPEPDNSSLVKNGAQDIRALGDAIDTSVWNVGYGQAGKNKIINGDFGIWQRGTSFTPANDAYTADRFQVGYNGTITTQTLSQQTFTPGTAPVAGYEGQYFLRWAITTNGTSTFRGIRQRIEDVRTFAGQTVSFSFWAKAASNLTLSSVQYAQIFGSGGSGTVEGSFTMNSLSVTTSWQRFTGTVTIPSINGKTITTNSSLAINIYLPATGTLDLWGWQLEAGSVATAFQTATGTIQGELSAAQRYYYRTSVTGATSNFGVGFNNSTTTTQTQFSLPQEMRIAPTALEQSGTATDYAVSATGGPVTCSAVPTHIGASNKSATFTLTVASGLTAGQCTTGRAANSSAYLGWSAEL
jgi:hypothetical protein